MLGFYVPPTAKVIRRRDLDLKSHPKDWRSPSPDCVGPGRKLQRQVFSRRSSNILPSSSLSLRPPPEARDSSCFLGVTSDDVDDPLVLAVTSEVIDDSSFHVVTSEEVDDSLLAVLSKDNDNSLFLAVEFEDNEDSLFLAFKSEDNEGSLFLAFKSEDNGGSLFLVFMSKVVKVSLSLEVGSEESSFR